MAYEFIVSFDNPVWYTDHKAQLTQEISTLPTYVDRGRLGEYRLQGVEDRETSARWSFDVRIFMEPDRLFVELSANPPSIKIDLKQLVAWLRDQTTIAVHDEDGDASNW